MDLICFTVAQTAVTYTVIAGKFGEEFNLANWQGIERITKLKIAKF